MKLKILFLLVALLTSSVSVAGFVNPPTPTTKGGTGQSTYTDGQLLIGNSSNNKLSKATITAGTGITVTNGNGTIQIDSTGGNSTTSTDTASYTLTITATSSNPTYGTITYNEARYHRMGDCISITFSLFTNGGTAGSGVYLFNLPSGLSIDTAKLTPSTTGQRAVVGKGFWSNNGTITATTQIPLWVFAYDTTHLALGFTNPASGNNIGGLIGRDLGDLSGNFIVSFTATDIPISGYTHNN